MIKSNLKLPTLKEIETDLFRTLQITYAETFSQLLTELDQHLQFEGAKGLSPLVQEMAMELAVEGQPYRIASHTLEKLLGYSVISHEAIRQHLQFYNESLKSSVGEAVRNNVSYLHQATGKPIYQALKGLQGF